MVTFTAVIKKFDEKGEKTGWTYIEIPESLANQLKPVRTSFRVKGKLDTLSIKSMALIPMGDGCFILPLKNEIRKILKKGKNDSIHVSLTVDDEPIKPSADFMECLQDEPKALKFYNSLSNSHRKYFNNWIESAKTSQTKAKRIINSIDALSKGFHYGQMIQQNKKVKQGHPF